MTDSTNEPTTQPTAEQTRALMLEWLRTKAWENLTLVCFQLAEDHYRQATATTSRVAKDVGQLVSKDKPTRYFLVPGPMADEDTTIEVKHNQYDSARPYIGVVELEPL